MFLFVTGGSGAGKSTVRRLVTAGLSPEIECVELHHVSRVPPFPSIAWRQEATEAAVRRAVELHPSSAETQPRPPARLPERYLLAMPFRVISPDGLQWITRPHDEGEPARHVAELSEIAGFAHTRANLWRYEPGARGRRHRHPHQEETFVVQSGTLTMYLGEPPVRVQVQQGGLIHVDAMTPLQVVNNETEDLVLYAYGYPPEDEHAEILEPAI